MLEETTYVGIEVPVLNNWAGLLRALQFPPASQGASLSLLLRNKVAI